MEANSKFKIVFSCLIFMSLYVCFLVTHYTNNLSLFFDIPAMFFTTIDNYDNPDKHYFMYSAFDNIRYFSNFLLVLPFNLLGIPLAKDSILALSNSFSLSYLIMHFVALVINVLVARRTKRYDILVIAFSLYAICSIPNLIWPVREVHFAALLYFPLLSYFLSNTQLSKRDILPVLLLVIYMFESFEITFVYGLLLFAFMNLYSKKEDVKNIWFKILIGLGGLGASLYIPSKLLYFMHFKNLVFHQNLGPLEWLHALKQIYIFLFISNIIIFFFALIVVVCTIFYKKEYNFKSLLFFVPFVILMAYCTYQGTGFYHDLRVEINNYSFIFLLIFPTILTILCLDYKKIEIKQYFVTNLLMVACFFGSVNLCWQIYSNLEYGKYTATLKEVMQNSDDVFAEIPEDLYFKHRHIRSAATCFSMMPVSILLSDNKQVEKVIVPSSYYDDYSDACFYDKEHTYFDAREKFLWVQSAKIKPQSSLLDVTKIVDELKNRGWVKN